jgi:3-dehydroquinate synthase
MTTTRIPVEGQAPYDVLVGHGLLAELPPLLVGATRVAIIHPPTLRMIAEAVRGNLIGEGFESHSIEVPDGEGAKTLSVAGFCWDVLGQAGFTRSDAVVGLGGGATTDLAGWSMPPSAARRASTPIAAKTWSGRFTHRRGCCATSRCS